MELKAGSALCVHDEACAEKSGLSFDTTYRSNSDWLDADAFHVNLWANEKVLAGATPFKVYAKVYYMANVNGVV